MFFLVLLVVHIHVTDRNMTLVLVFDGIDVGPMMMENLKLDGSMLIMEELACVGRSIDGNVMMDC